MASSNNEGKRGQVGEGGNSRGSRSVDCGRARARSGVLSSVDWVQRRSLCLLWAQVAAGQKKEKSGGGPLLKGSYCYATASHREPPAGVCLEPHRGVNGPSNVTSHPIPSPLAILITNEHHQ